MSPTTWTSALILGALTAFANAEPLVTHTVATGQISGLDQNFSIFGNVQTGMPVSSQFDFEVNTSYALVTPGSFIMQTQGFHAFNMTVNGVYHQFDDYAYRPTTIALQDDVTNSAGEVIDVLDLSTHAGTSVLYTMTTHLEFGAATFTGLDAWSILALEDAPLLAGTIHLNYYSERYDGTFIQGNLYADIDAIGFQFTGPGADIPAVPEPGAPAMLLAGLAGTVLLRRRAATAGRH